MAKLRTPSYVPIGKDKRPAVANYPEDSGSANEIVSSLLKRYQVHLIPTDQIRPDPNQPRKHIDQDKMHKLKESIEKDGLIAPILLRKDPEILGYMIVVGENRYWAMRELGLKEMPAFLSEAFDTKSPLRHQIVENTHRNDLHPVDLAHSVNLLAMENDVSFSEASESLGFSKSKTSTLLALLNIPNDMLDLVQSQQLTSERVIYELTILSMKSPGVYKDSIAEIRTALKLGPCNARSIIASVKSKHLKQSAVTKKPAKPKETTFIAKRIEIQRPPMSSSVQLHVSHSAGSAVISVSLELLQSLLDEGKEALNKAIIEG